MKIDQPCWIRIDAGLTVKCRLTCITPDRGVVVVPPGVSLPESCDLYFRADGKVGRKCKLRRQSGDLAELDITGKIGELTPAEKDIFEV
jgi:hypothetical protein